MELKERLRSQRRIRGLTQKELGNLIKISEITIRRWESTKSSQVPDATNLRALADVLNTTVSYLTGETDDPTPVGGTTMKNHVINSGTGNATAIGDNARVSNSVQMGKSGESDKLEMPWWVKLPQEVYQTVQQGTPQDISNAKAAMRQGLAMLEQAEQAKT